MELIRYRDRERVEGAEELATASTIMCFCCKAFRSSSAVAVVACLCILSASAALLLVLLHHPRPVVAGQDTAGSSTLSHDGLEYPPWSGTASSLSSSADVFVNNQILPAATRSSEVGGARAAHLQLPPPRLRRPPDGTTHRRTLMFAAGPGSFPPRCTAKCGTCNPCKPVHVPVPPGRLVTTMEYYPEAWRCKCGNMLYMP